MALPALEGKLLGAERGIHQGNVMSLTDTTAWGTGHSLIYSFITEPESQRPGFNKTQKFPVPLGTQLEHIPEAAPGSLASTWCSGIQKVTLVVVSWKMRAL